MGYPLHFDLFKKTPESPMWEGIHQVRRERLIFIDVRLAEIY